MGKLRVYCLKTLNKLSIYPLGNTPSAPSVSALVVDVVLIAEGMGALLVCNHPQSQDANTQIDVNKNKVVSDGSPGLDLPERRLETMNQEAIPLMLRSSGSGWATREMGTTFVMVGASYLPWLVGTLEERPGEGYWLSFNQRLPISYELGDHLYGELPLSQRGAVCGQIGE